MKMRRWVGCGLLLVMMLVSVEAFAGGWTQKRGASYTKLWLRGLVGSAVFLLESPTLPTGGTYTDFSLNAYSEIGVHDRLTLILFGTPFGHASYAENGSGDGTGYVGALNMGVRWGFYQGPIKLALEVHYGYVSPVGERAVGEGILRGQRWFYQPVVSTHRFDGELQFGYGFSIGSSVSAWISGSFGVRQHTRMKLGTILVGSLQFGAQLPLGFVPSIYFNLYYPLRDIDEINVSGAGQTSYAGNGISLSYWITKSFGLTASLEGIFFAFANASTPSILFGVEIR